MYLGQNIKQILPGNVAVGGANMGMVPLFSVQWCPSRNAIWAGYVPADGQELDDNLFPDAAAGIAANNVPTTSNANWLADPAARGAYVAGSSAGKFRVPDYNGKSSGSLGAVFLRGDGTLSAAIAGVIQQDATQRITGQWVNDWSTSAPVIPLTTGAVSAQSSGSTAGRSPTTHNQTGTLYTFDSQNSPGARTSTETRPLNVTGCWVIKLFGAVTNMASADAAQLASSYASLGARIGQLEMTERLPLGFGQTWQDVTGTRTIGTTYTNTTGRPIQLDVSFSRTGAWSFHFIIDGVGGGVGGGYNPIIPPGSTYRAVGTGVTGMIWRELR